jgi:hypothetical protein
MSTKIVLQAVAAAALLFAGTSSGALAAPFTNGSFEDLTNFVNQGDDTESLGNGSTAMPGWTVTAPSGHSIAWIGPTNPFGLTASDGGYLLDLTGYDSGGGAGVEQSFTTVQNGQYTVTFDLGGGNGVSIDGAVNGAHQTFSGGSLSTATSWDPQVMTFIASGTTSLLSLVGSTSVNNYIGLDHVQVTFNGLAATPLPGSVVMFGTGLLGLGFAGYRRGKKTAFSAPSAI